MEKIYSYLQKSYNKIIGWGTGGYYSKYSELLSINVEYLIDSNRNLHYKNINGRLVNSPDILKDEDPEKTLIIIYSSFYDEIVESIRSYGDFYTISGALLNDFASNLEIEKKQFYEKSEMKKSTIISISRNNFALYIGGTSKFIREQMEILNKNEYVNLHIYWKEYNLKGFSSLMINIVKDGIELGLFSLEEFCDKVKNVKAIIIHNLIGMKSSILDTILDSISNEISILYYLHDFSCLCKSIKLIYNNEELCKSYETNWSRCSTCISGEDRINIFNYHKGLFHRKNIKIIAPSASTKNIIKKSFEISDDKIKIINHQEFNEAITKKDIINDRIRIAYVGYKHIFKGWEIFKKLFFEFKDTYDFYCLGANDEIIEGIKYVDVSFIEDGHDAMTKKLKEYSIDVSLLWSLWPETYSYTYFESYAAGTFIITNELSGNIADQVRKNDNGFVLKDYEDLKNLLNSKEELKKMILRNNKIINNLITNDEFLKLF